jgi:hypothetical protein
MAGAAGAADADALAGSLTLGLTGADDVPGGIAAAHAAARRASALSAVPNTKGLASFTLPLTPGAGSRLRPGSLLTIRP